MTKKHISVTLRVNNPVDKIAILSTTFHLRKESEDKIVILFIRNHDNSPFSRKSQVVKFCYYFVRNWFFMFVSCTKTNIRHSHVKNVFLSHVKNVFLSLRSDHKLRSCWSFLFYPLGKQITISNFVLSNKELRSSATKVFHVSARFSNFH